MEHSTSRVCESLDLAFHMKNWWGVFWKHHDWKPYSTFAKMKIHCELKLESNQHATQTNTWLLCHEPGIQGATNKLQKVMGSADYFKRRSTYTYTSQNGSSQPLVIKHVQWLLLSFSFYIRWLKKRFLRRVCLKKVNQQHSPPADFLFDISSCGAGYVWPIPSAWIVACRLSDIMILFLLDLILNKKHIVVLQSVGSLDPCITRLSCK